MVRRKKSLGRSYGLMEVVLSIKTPDGWVADVQRKYPSTIKILSCKRNQYYVQDLVEISAPREVLREVLGEVRQSSRVLSAEVMDTDHDRAVAIVKSEDCIVCKSFLASDVFLTSARTQPDGTSDWTLTVAGNEALRRVLKSLHDGNIGVRVKKMVRLSRKDIITARQEQVLAVAVQAGYYDFPRRISQTELASRMGMATATVSEILRRGERKIVGEYLRKGFG
ncbi:MAG: helix-turn-helix domain-containing protein [Thaumarchaeota archaeon]|nr:helix-turn-helix domain-containing protein [Nitrososphaerota archaeon]